MSDEVLVPLTVDEFENMLAAAASKYSLEITDRLRSSFAVYVHHIPNDVNTIDMEKLSRILHKAVSNAMTWELDQEIKLAARKKAEEKAKEQSKVIPIKEETLV